MVLPGKWHILISLRRAPYRQFVEAGESSRLCRTRSRGHAQASDSLCIAYKSVSQAILFDRNSHPPAPVYTLAFASAVSFACLINPLGASPRGIYTSIKRSLSGLLNAASASRSDNSWGVLTTSDSYGVYGARDQHSSLVFRTEECAHLALLASQEWQQQLMIIQLNVIVFRIPSVDLSFDLVPIVVENKDVRMDTTAQHRSDLLQGLYPLVSLHHPCILSCTITDNGSTYQLKRSVSDEQDCPSRTALLLRCERTAQTSAH